MKPKPKTWWCVWIRGREDEVPVLCRKYASAASLAKDLIKLGFDVTIAHRRLHASR